MAKLNKKLKLPTGTNELLIWKIPPALKKKFKMACLRKDIDMRTAVLRFMKEFSS